MREKFSMHDEEFNSIFLFIFLRNSFSIQVDRRRYLTIEERGKEKNEGKEERRKRKGLTYQQFYKPRRGGCQLVHGLTIRYPGNQEAIGKWGKRTLANGLLGPSHLPVSPLLETLTSFG
jgi:hypothetical protein